MRSKLRQIGSIDAYEISSAGLNVLTPSGANHKSISVCAENGIDLSSHQARQIDDEMIFNSNLILTMTQAHKFDIMNKASRFGNKIFTLKEYAAKYNWNLVDNDLDISDPYGCEMTIYRETFKMIDSYIDLIIKNILKLEEI